MDTKYLVFDFGGTLADYENMPLSWADSYPTAFKELQKKLGIEFSEAQVDSACNILKKYNPRINPRTEEIPAEIIFGEIKEVLKADVSAENLSVLFYQYYQTKLIIYDDTKTALEELKKNGSKIAVLSDLPTAMSHSTFVEDINKTGFDFDVVLSSQKAGYRKPEINGLQMIAKEFNCPLENLIFIGDEKKDMETIARAGGTGVLINRKKLAVDYGQKYTINSLSELI